MDGYNRVVATYEQPFASPYGWAAHHLKSKKPIFSDLEAAAGRAQMRSYYKMASYSIHAGLQGITSQLGTYDYRTLILAGASNAGLSEPGQNAAFTLSQITALLFGPRPNLEDTIQLQTIANLRDEIPPAFLRAENKLKRDDAKHRRNGKPAQNSRPR